MKLFDIIMKYRVGSREISINHAGLSTEFLKIIKLTNPQKYFEKLSALISRHLEMAIVWQDGHPRCQNVDTTFYDNVVSGMSVDSNCQKEQGKSLITLFCPEKK